MANSKNTIELCGKRSILINTNNLNHCSKYNLNVILKCHKRVIVKGTVYNSNKIPSIGAAIEVIQVNCDSNVKKIIGYAYTNNRGEYLFCLEVLPDIFYEMNIYSPLNM
ncbi:hypothetical protein BS101_13885 [Clostridium kluyveri]|uniref:Carboxypeptidase regulatory-like domain-containing protein n=2 Tax=Clostridium kluyveri TaxID=1534 RepID=A0A1L5FEA3_CLOKL|nr:hypothetical protein BS101_13885 [Clostridium kluyveri]